VRRTLVFDNVSYLDPRISDLLARVSTGGELVSRTLYTNDSAHITVLKRPVWINGIIAGFSRSDLASRAVKVEMKPIPEGTRASASDLQDKWQSARPAITRGMLDLLVQVLRHRSSQTAAGSTHRNGDLIRVIKVVDNVLGTRGLQRLNEGIADFQATVIDASPLAAAIRSFVECARSEGGRRCCADDWGRLEQEHLTWPEIRSLIDRHVEEAQQRDQPQVAKAFGEQLDTIHGDLEANVGVQVQKKRFTDGNRYRFTDLRRQREDDEQ
jgi:hypothetical protein